MELQADVSFGSMPPVPIFDTSAVVNLSKRGSADPIWKHLKRAIPRHGCPLSYITVLELFHGLSVGGIDKLDDSLKALILASRLSRRRVCLAPYAFVEMHLFEITDSRHERSRAALQRWLRISVGPDFKRMFASGTVKGISLEKVESLFAVVRDQHSFHVAQYLDRLHPGWRLERQKFRSSVPADVRETIKRTYPLDKWKRLLPEQLLEAMNIERTQEAIAQTSAGCDAYFTFTVNLLRDSLMTDYKFEDNSNDFHDGLQLLYLSRPSFCLVTDDKRSILRTRGSNQGDRILTVDQFLSGSQAEVGRAAAG